MNAKTTQNNGTRDKPGVLLTGEYQHSEFCEAHHLLHADADSQIIMRLPAAVEFIRAGNTSFDLIVIAQGRPGEIAASDVDDLCRNAPQAHKLWLLGNWCEGERCLRSDATILEHSYWYEFPGWWRRFSQGIPAKSPDPNWKYNTPAPQPDTPPGAILVDTPHFTSFETIATTLGEAGVVAVWWRSGQRLPVVTGASGGIWDGGQLSFSEETLLKVFCETISPVGPVVAILDFPRRDRVEAAKAIGASSVLGRPWLTDDLLAELRIPMLPASQTEWLRNDCPAA
jgi:hypothetical protein